MASLTNRLTWLVLFATLIAGANSSNLRSLFFEKLLPSKLLDFSVTNGADVEEANFKENSRGQDAAFEIISKPPENIEEENTDTTLDNELSWTTPAADNAVMTEEETAPAKPWEPNNFDLVSYIYGILKPTFDRLGVDGYGVKYLISKGSNVVKNLLKENPKNLVISLMKAVENVYGRNENVFKDFAQNLLNNIVRCSKPVFLNEKQQSTGILNGNFKVIFQKLIGMLSKMLQEEPPNFLASSQRLWEKIVQRNFEETVKKLLARMLKPNELESADQFEHLVKALYRKTLSSLSQTPPNIIQNALESVRQAQNVLRSKLEKVPSFYERYLPRLLGGLDDINKIKLLQQGNALLKSISSLLPQTAIKSDEGIEREPEIQREKMNNLSDIFSRLYKRIGSAMQKFTTEAPKNDRESEIAETFDESIGISREEYAKMFETLENKIGNRFSQSSRKSKNLFLRLYGLLTRDGSNSYTDHLIELHVIHTVVLKSLESDVYGRESEYAEVFSKVCQNLFGSQGEKFWKNWRYFPNYFQDAWKKILNEKKYQEAEAVLKSFQTEDREPTSRIQQSKIDVTFQKIIPIGPDENLSEFSNWHQYLLEKLGTTFQKSSGISMYAFIKLFKNLRDRVGPKVSDELGEIYALHTHAFNKWRPQILSDLDAYINAFVKTTQNVFGTNFENFSHNNLLGFVNYFQNIWNEIRREKSYKKQDFKLIQIHSDVLPGKEKQGFNRRQIYQDEYYNQILSELAPRQPIMFDYDILHDIPLELIGTLRYIGGKYFPYDERNFFDLSRRLYRNYVDRYSYNPMNFLHHLLLESSHYYDNPSVITYWPNIRDFFNVMYQNLNNKIQKEKNPQEDLFTRFMKKIEKRFKENTENATEVAKQFYKSVDDKINNITSTLKKSQTQNKVACRLNRTPTTLKDGVIQEPQSPTVPSKLHDNTTTTTLLHTSETEENQKPITTNLVTSQRNMTTTVPLSTNKTTIEHRNETTSLTSQQNITVIMPLPDTQQNKTTITLTSEKNITTIIPVSTGKKLNPRRKTTTPSTSTQNITLTKSNSEINITTTIPLHFEEAANPQRNETTTTWTSHQNITNTIPFSTDEVVKFKRNTTTTTSTFRQNVTVTKSTSQQNKTATVSLPSEEVVTSQRNKTATTSSKHKNITDETVKYKGNITTMSTSQQNITTTKSNSSDSENPQPNKTIMSQQNITTDEIVKFRSKNKSSEETVNKQKNVTTIKSTSQQNISTNISTSQQNKPIIPKLLEETAEDNTKTSHSNITTNITTSNHTMTTLTSQHNITAVKPVYNVTVPEIIDEISLETKLKTFSTQTHSYNYSEFHNTIEDRWVSEYNKIFMLIHEQFPDHEGDRYAKDVYRLMLKLMAFYGEHNIDFKSIRRLFIQTFINYFVNSNLNFDETANVFVQKIEALSAIHKSWSTITRVPSYFSISDLGILEEKLPQEFDVVCVNKSLSAMGEELQLLNISSSLSNISTGIDKFLNYYIPCYKTYLLNVDSNASFSFLKPSYEKSDNTLLIHTFFKSMMLSNEHPYFPRVRIYKADFFNFLKRLFNSLKMRDKASAGVYFMAMDFFEQPDTQSKNSTEIANTISDFIEKTEKNRTEAVVECQKKDVQAVYGKYYNPTLYWLAVENPIHKINLTLPNTTKHRETSANTTKHCETLPNIAQDWRFLKSYDKYLWSFVNTARMKSKNYIDYFVQLKKNSYEKYITFLYIHDKLEAKYREDLYYCSSVKRFFEKAYQKLIRPGLIRTVFIDAFSEAYETLYPKIFPPCIIKRGGINRFSAKFDILYKEKLSKLHDSQIGRLYGKLKQTYNTTFEYVKSMYEAVLTVFTSENFKENLFEKAYKSFDKRVSNEKEAFLSAYERLLMKENSLWRGYKFYNVLKTIEDPTLNKTFVQVMEALGNEYDKADQIHNMLERLPYESVQFVEKFVKAFRRYGINNNIKVYKDIILEGTKVQYETKNFTHSSTNITETYVKVHHCPKQVPPTPFYVEREPTNPYDVCEHPEKYGLVTDQTVIDMLKKEFPIKTV